MMIGDDLFRLSLLQGESLSVSKAAWLIVRYQKECWGDGNELHSVLYAVETSVGNYDLALAAVPSAPRTDPRIISIPSDESSLNIPVHLYTEYDKVSDNYYGQHVSFVDSPNDADVLLLLQPVKNFLSYPISQYVCQFPYEGGLVRKDLLPLTVRRFCNEDGSIPSWWLACFDMSTEFHCFCNEFYQRSRKNLPNSWILKPAADTRTRGHIFVPSPISSPSPSPSPLPPSSLYEEMSSPAHETETNTETDVDTNSIFSSQGVNRVPSSVRMTLSQIAALCPLFSVDKERLRQQGRYSGDRVAQLVVEHPLLLNNRKFDLRLFVVVRSFVPFEAYVHNVFYARVAHAEYPKSVTDALSDPLASLTVCAYNDDPVIAEQQVRLLDKDLRRALSLERPDIALAWDEVVVAPVHRLLSQLLRGCAPAIGSWPRSRAYYGVDVIFDDSAYYYYHHHLQHEHHHRQSNVQTQTYRESAISASESPNHRGRAGGDEEKAEGSNGDSEANCEGETTGVIAGDKAVSNSVSAVNHCSSSTSIGTLKSEVSDDISKTAGLPSPGAWTDEPALRPVPKLLEVNFMGDWTGMEAAMGEGSDALRQWVTDMVDCLATSAPVDGARMTRL